MGIYRRYEQVSIIHNETFCPRCRYVAAQEFLNNRKIRDSSNPEAAIKAWDIVNGTPVPRIAHLHESGKCNAPKDWRY